MKIVRSFMLCNSNRLELGHGNQQNYVIDVVLFVNIDLWKPYQENPGYLPE